MGPGDVTSNPPFSLPSYGSYGYYDSADKNGPGPVLTSLKAFNEDLDAWSTPSALSMSSMFERAKAFDNGGQ